MQLDQLYLIDFNVRLSLLTALCEIDQHQLFNFFVWISHLDYEETQLFQQNSSSIQVSLEALSFAIIISIVCVVRFKVIDY